MATEHQTLEASASDMDAAPPTEVRRGKHILRVLQHAARAARLETQVIELQSALNQADRGDSRMLQLWLASYDQQSDSAITFDQPAIQMPATIESRIEALQVNNAVTNPVAFAPTTAVPSSDENGWSVYLTHARRRLAAIQTELGDEQPWLEPANSFVVTQTPATAVGSPTAMDPPITSIDGAEISTSLLDDELVDELAEDPANELSEECLTSLADLRKGDDAHTAPSQPLSKRICGSYGLSILGHALVLLVLGSITYQAPTEGSSLGSQVLQAAESSSEVELNSDVEMFEPAELQMSEPMSEAVTPSTSMASELTQLSQSATAVTVEVPIANNLGSTIASAMSEAASKSSSGSRSSGAPSMSGNFFGVGTGGNYFCYVVDRSGSMRGGAWESAKAELIRSLKSLKATQKFYIIFFADEFEALPEPGSDQPASTGLYATPDNIDHARRWIQSVELNRGGPPNDALAWAIDREPDAIYLLTDGVTKVDVCGFLRKNNRIEDIVSGPQVRVPIHAIAYFSLDGQSLMRQLAKENQGQFIYVPKPKAKK